MQPSYFNSSPQHPAILSRNILWQKKFRNLRTSSSDPAQTQRPGLLTRNEPFRLQIELHRFCPPPCLRSARKQTLRQLRRHFGVHIIYRQTRQSFWQYLQYGPPHCIVHCSVDELHLTRMVHIFYFDHLSRHGGTPTIRSIRTPPYPVLL